jgi:hypothetical protein
MRRSSLVRHLALLSSVAAFGLASAPRAARAGNGPSVIVPKLATAPVWNPYSGCNASDWSEGVVVPFNATAKGRILRTDSDLWMCVSGVEPNSQGTGPSANDSVGFGLDTLHSWTPSYDKGDINLLILPTGRTTVSASANVGALFSAAPLSPNDYGAWGAEIQDAEFGFSWHAAARLSKHALGDVWQTIGLGMSEAGSNDATFDADWPAPGTEGSPAAWGNLVLDDGTTPLPSAESFFPVFGSTAQLGRPGDTVTIYGHYLDPITSVYFQNDDLSLDANTESDMLAPIVSRTPATITVTIPRQAVSGTIKLHTADGTVYSPPGAFTVTSYRDTWGYRFSNWDVSGPGDITFGDLTDVFGRDELYYLGFIPSLEAVTLWGVGVAILEGHGHCYGMSITSTRMRQGDQPLAPFDAAVSPPRFTFDLAGTNDSRPNTIAHHIAGWHFVQFSSENLRVFLQNQLASRIDPQYARNILQTELSAGNPVLVVTRQPTKGHVVVAYDMIPVTSGPNAGGYDIKVYDNDVEFRQGAGQDQDEQPSGKYHTGREEQSTIHVWPNGNWSHLSTHPNGWTGGPADLVVEQYGELPKHPTLPWTLEGLFTIASGDTGTTQLSDDAGHTLLAADGTENTSDTTRLPNTARFTPDSGDGAPMKGDAFVSLATGKLHQTLHATTNGTYSHAFMGRGVTGSLDGVPAVAGTDDDVRFETTTGTLDFRTKAKSKAFSAQLTGRTTSGAERAIQIGGATSVAGGSDVMKLDAARNAMTYAHAGKATAATITLTQNDTTGARTFIATNQSLADGDTATLTPASWSSLDTTTVSMVVKHKNGTTTKKTLHNCGGTFTGPGNDGPGGVPQPPAMERTGRIDAPPVSAADDSPSVGLDESAGGCSVATTTREAGGAGFFALFASACALLLRRAWTRRR